ncbi:hypothetical protein tb265_36420 [Gemmatimonadetes bacterium T265]|nr:hypothetical protein tb265_36420 [Gemmatimonadetes bacterium T265]
MTVPPGAPRVRHTPVRLSVCIPAYNRPAEFRELLDSILAQQYPHYEVVVSEDHSPQRAEIRAIVEAYRPRFNGGIRYFENAANIGYDANYRALVRRATGDYCFVMGNDDVVAPGAFATAADVIGRTPNVGVVLRSLAYFYERPDEFFTIARYSADELRFPPGLDTIVQFYRRCAIMSGVVIHRGEALAHETDRFDGLLYYQFHLVANVLWRRPGVIVPEVLAYYREGRRKEFGTSPVERGRFTPGEAHDIDDALRLIESSLTIAGGFDAEHGTNLRARVLRDMARYSYHTFAHHGEQPWAEYGRLYAGLARFGFWRDPLFHAWAAAVAVVGPRRLQASMHAIRRRLGYTPSLGERPRDAVVLRSPRLGAAPHALPAPRADPAPRPADPADADPGPVPVGAQS